MPVIDWLEEILRAATQQEELSLADGLRGIALLRYTGSAEAAAVGYSRLPALEETFESGRNGPEQSRSVRSDTELGSKPSRTDSGLQGLYRPLSRGSVLQVLYRQVVQAVTAVQPPAAGREPAAVLQEEAPAAAGMTAEKLDRLVRRDSRRYDGGMSIY